MKIGAILLFVIFQDFGQSFSTDDVDGVVSISTLVEAASNNSVINITNITVLSSNVVLKYFENITIIGDSINCNSSGSVKFISCNNVTIKSASWTKCGTLANPAIGFYNSSTIEICNCSFYNSTGQAVVLSKVSANVYINNCKFTENNQFKGHGVALLISLPEQLVHLNVFITNCDFSFNGPTKSIVYFNGTPNYNALTLQNSRFSQNQGVPIYISHTSLILHNNVLFKDNKAIAGGAIYSSNSIIKFDGDNKPSQNVTNSLTILGDCCTYNSTVKFNGNTSVTFVDNSADTGGAIYLC